MKAVLIDSDILIEVSRARDPDILARWEELGRGEGVMLCSPMTIAELCHRARPHEHKALASLFGAMTPIPIEAEIGQRAGVYLRRYSRSHHVELGDALIAATAAIHQVDLWTGNRKHYPMNDVTFY